MKKLGNPEHGDNEKAFNVVLLLWCGKGHQSRHPWEQVGRIAEIDCFIYHLCGTKMEPFTGREFVGRRNKNSHLILNQVKVVEGTLLALIYPNK